MDHPWRFARIGVATLGLFYGLPVIVAGFIVGGSIGGVLMVAGLGLSAVAAVRGSRVDLRVDEDRQIVVRNRWRTVAFMRDKRPQLEPVTPWWMLLTRMATVDILGVREDGRRLTVPVLATLGKDRSDPQIARLIGDLSDDRGTG